VNGDPFLIGADEEKRRDEGEKATGARQDEGEKAAGARQGDGAGGRCRGRRIKWKRAQETGRGSGARWAAWFVGENRRGFSQNVAEDILFGTEGVSPRRATSHCCYVLGVQLASSPNPTYPCKFIYFYI
jgi:hypothetical protein